MPNENLNPNRLRSMDHRSIPVLRLPASVHVPTAVRGSFMTAASDIAERARLANVPVVSPQFEAVTPRNVGNNLRGFWNSTVRPLVVPARRHA